MSTYLQCDGCDRSVRDDGDEYPRDWLGISIQVDGVPYGDDTCIRSASERAHLCGDCVGGLNSNVKIDALFARLTKALRDGLRLEGRSLHLVDKKEAP